MSALVAMLSGRYRMSRRNVQRFIADTHGIDIALGSISNIEGVSVRGSPIPMQQR